jgi:Bardet-Biedl syndrome 2 protein
VKTPGTPDLNKFLNLLFMFSQPHVEISLSTNNETIISAVMVFAEGIFEGETHVLHPKDSEVTSRLDVALYPPRDVPVDIHIKVKRFIS